MNVLIVEDDPLALKTMANLVMGRGHQVAVARSAEEAEELISGKVFQIAVLDWMLPGKSGPDFCRWLRSEASGEDIYVFLVSARGTPDDLDEALTAGANDYLVKPWDGDNFRARLRIAERQVMDITDRIKNRMALRESTNRMERLALVARQTQNGVVILNDSGEIEWTNDAFTKMLQIGPEAEDETNFISLLESIDPDLRREMEKAILTGSPSEGELAVPTIDSSKHWLHYSLTPLISDKNVSRGLVCFFSDISTVKMADEERFKTSKIESLGVLAGGIAHDLNNILTVISGNLSLARLCLEKEIDRAADHLDKANNATLRAADLSKQLLTFAKGGAPVKQVVDVRERIEKATRFSLYGSNLTSSFSFERGLRYVEADPFQLEQVINNIVINAREAMPDGGLLQVRAINETLAEGNPLNLPSGDYIRISFSDNGTGIPADILPEIFDPYFTTKPTGSGIGLTISFSILAKHGGRIIAESDENGATFSLLIPCANEKVDSRVSVPPPCRDRRTVLCMDDEPSIRELLTAILTMSDYSVTTAADGDQALAAYREKLEHSKRFDVVILDATIPGGMGGVETIKALVRLDPEVRAIICSGYSDESALAAMESFGFKASLPKPFTSTQLCGLIEKVISANPGKQGPEFILENF